MKLLKNAIDIAGMGLARVASSVLSFVTLSLIARSIIPEDLGLYSIVLAMYAYVGLLSEFGLRSLALSESAGPEIDKDHMLSFVYARLIVSIVVLGASALICSFIYPQDFLLVCLIFAAVIPVALQIDWILMLEGQYHLASLVVVIRSISFLAFVSVFVLTSSLQIHSLALAFFLSWVVSSISSWLFSIRLKNTKLSTESIQNAWKSVSSYLKRGWPIVAGSLVAQLFANSDLLWIGYFSGRENAAYYYIASGVTTAALCFANALSQYVLSRYGKHKNQDDKTKLKEEVSRDTLLAMLLSVVLCVGFSVFGPWLLPIIFGEQYTIAARILPAFTIYLLAYHFYAILYASYVAFGYQAEALRRLSISVIALVILFLAASTFGTLEYYAYAKGILILFVTVYMLYGLPLDLQKIFKPLYFRALVISFILGVLLTQGYSLFI